ncbi:hypothetical protein GIJ05_05405, partial [Laceyella tengchongensis]|nr:hypothetical protein [Laceyella tengchongensis]
MHDALCNRVGNEGAKGMPTSTLLAYCTNHVIDSRIETMRSVTSQGAPVNSIRKDMDCRPLLHKNERTAKNKVTLFGRKGGYVNGYSYA